MNYKENTNIKNKAITIMRNLERGYLVRNYLYISKNKVSDHTNTNTNNNSNVDNNRANSSSGKSSSNLSHTSVEITLDCIINNFSRVFKNFKIKLIPSLMHSII